MALLRLANGGDLKVTLSVAEVVVKLGEGDPTRWIEFPGADTPVHVRASAILAVIDSGDDRKQAGFFRTP